MEADLPNDVELEINDEVVEVIPTFVEMGLSCDLLRGIYNCGFEKPSAFQKCAIKHMIRGRDLVGQAPPGTGKTVAYAIAVLQGIDMQVRGTQALILVPNHDLAVQIEKVFIALGHFIGTRCRACTAETDVDEDIRKLAVGQQIVVGTPRRIFNLIKRRSLRTREVRMQVWEEAEELLSKTFKDQLYNIYRYLPPNAQAIMISAKFPTDLLEMTTKIMNNPVRVLVKGNSISAETKQFFVRFNREEWKFDTMCDLYGTFLSTQAIVFCNTQRKVDWLIARLGEANFTFCSINPSMKQGERDATMQQFRNSETRIFVGTDDCAHALVNLPQVSLIINYDLPNHRDLYIRRVCRLGGHGCIGVVINFVMEQDIRILNDFEQYYETQIEELPMNAGQEFAANDD